MLLKTGVENLERYVGGSFPLRFIAVYVQAGETKEQALAREPQAAGLSDDQVGGIL